MRSAESTRRETLRAGLLAGGAFASAAALARAEVAGGAPGDEAEMEALARMVRLEQTAAIAYRALTEGVALRRPVADTAALFGRQAEEHADALAEALGSLAGAWPQPPRPTDIEGLGDVRTQADFLAFAIRMENRTVRGYVDALQELESPGPLRLCTSLMASAGQHLVVLRQQLGASPSEAVPDPFETGTVPPP